MKKIISRISVLLAVVFCFTLVLAGCSKKLAFKDATLTEGTVGKAYEESIAVAGAKEVTYTAESGSLPEGLSLSSEGVLSGTPTAKGEKTFEVTASGKGYSDTTASFTLNIKEGALSYENKTVEVAVNVPSTETLAFATGGVNVKYTIKSGTLPAGLTLAEDGKITGTATAIGSSEIVVTASAKDCASADATITVNVVDKKPVEPDDPPKPPTTVVIDETKTVSKLAVLKDPDKTYYEVGEEFTVEGGMVTVTYTDGSTQEVPMTSPSFTVAKPSMSAVGTKNINVKYGTKKCTFTIRIAAKSFSIVYHLNYEGAPEAETVKVVQGDQVENKAVTREGYTFQGWYANSDYIYLYDFNAEKGAQANADLYALWLKDGVEHYTVTFDHGYYGDLYETYSYKVDAGAQIEKPSDPVRFGYKFLKWTTASGAAYDFNQKVSSEVKLTATWEKTITGTQTYVFEAEDTDLTNKVGPAFSGTCSENGMIVPAPANRGCSNDRFVSYLYRNGNSLEFYVAADEDLNDVTIYARLSAELRDFTYTPENFKFYLNDEELKYAPIVFTNVPQNDDPAAALDCLDFKDFVIATKVNLKKGQNLIRLVTENSIAMEGTTLEAAAPIVDCIKIETTGVVIWDANKSLPFAGNY